MTSLLLPLFANAAAFGLILTTVLFDRAALKRRRAAESAARLAVQERIAELRKENRAFEELYGAL